MFEKPKLINKAVPIEVLEPERVYLLTGVSPVLLYGSDKKPTDTIVGYKYTVVNIESFEKYVIKVEGTKPLISAELLAEKREKGEKVYVEFDNATIKMYWNSKVNSYADSFKADAIHFVETED